MERGKDTKKKKKKKQENKPKKKKKKKTKKKKKKKCRTGKDVNRIVNAWTEGGSSKGSRVMDWGKRGQSCEGTPIASRTERRCRFSARVTVTPGNLAP